MLPMVLESSMETLNATRIYLSSRWPWATLDGFNWLLASFLKRRNKSISHRQVNARHALETGKNSLALRQYLALYSRRNNLTTARERLDLAMGLNIYGRYRQAYTLLTPYCKNSRWSQFRVMWAFAADKLGHSTSRTVNSKSRKSWFRKFLEAGQAALDWSFFPEALYFAELALFVDMSFSGKTLLLKPRAIFLRARAQVAQGQFEAGVKSLLSIEEEFPNREKGERSPSEREDPNSIFTKADCTLFMLTMGKAEFGLHHYQKAQDWFNKALGNAYATAGTKVDILEEIWWWLSRCSEELGDKAEAKKDLWFAEEKYTRSESMPIVVLLSLLQKDQARAKAIARQLAMRYPMNRSLYLALEQFADYARTSTFKQKIAHRLHSARTVTLAGPAVDSLETQSASPVESKVADLTNPPEQRSGTTAADLPLKPFRLRMLPWSKRNDFAQIIHQDVDSMCKSPHAKTIKKREAFLHLSRTLHVQYPDFTGGKKLTHYDVKNLYYRKVKKEH